ncbi:aromatic acid exporter family protein [Fodinibacter luteus]|uniref:Aromatic acid exporter family protein n=1 Tax=Fodinibacter luteus TaxID=552064 RepID=A0ABP8K8Y5_9MICO
MTLLGARRALARGVDRLLDRWVLLLQIGVAVLLAWLVASELLGHDNPFFAPVTAILCLGLTYGQRLRRIVEVTVGVAIGVLVGDLIVMGLGSGAWQMALVVVLAMGLAVVVSSGQLLVIQAGVQSVFIVAFVADQSASFSRWVDAVMGGLVALVIGAVAPTSPVRRPRALAARTTREVATTLRDVVAALHRRDRVLAGAALDGARALETQLGELRTAAAEGSAVVRQSPLLRRHAPVAEASSALVVPLDRCVRNLRVLARRAGVAVARDEDVPEHYVDLVAALAAAAEDLARVLDEHATPSAGRRVLERVAGLSARVDPTAGLSAEMIRGQVRSMVVDLLVVAGLDEDEALRLVPESYLP